ncbi:hypothetical protein C7212DRAFT_195238, partial [Tuber magnatum]
LAMYNFVIKEKNAPLETCWGFVDRTLKQIAQPIYSQEVVYNGWKRKHCLKYQAIISPDSIMAYLYKSVKSRMYDAAV